MTMMKKLSLFSALIVAGVVAPATALAQGAPSAATPASNQFDTNAWLGLAAAIAIGLAALGGTTAQGRATAAALEGIARQPSAAARIQTPMILGLALIESLVLFTWVIALFLWNSIKG
jgi:F-type H+-transporting ATPase subunit c